MFKIIYTAGNYTLSETFRNADDMRDWYEESGLADAVERGEVKRVTFLRMTSLCVAATPLNIWVAFWPAWLWD